MTDSDKRIYKRRNLQVPARFTIHGYSDYGYITNLSEGGCLLYCSLPDQLALYTPIGITLTFKNSPEEIKVKGIVVRGFPFSVRSNYENSYDDINYELAIEFIELNDNQKDFISRHL
jgi:hypothetical protein